ncbi:MAG: Holliday junction branch migration protein RuvA [Minisyncoccia bacterium]|jgi:Holliday junction DNA helicase RuvA
MIGYINGTIQSVSGNHVIVDVSGVGYRVSLPEKCLNSIAKIGTAVKLFTHYQMNPRDGSVELYGFTTPEELNFFTLLTTISGIGPKSAQAILSSADLQQLQIGIIRGDDAYLCKVAGVGAKTAQRLVLELKNKVMAADIRGGDGGELGAESEALDALVALGYSQYQARDAVKQLSDKSVTTEDKVKEALRLLSKK